MKHIFRAIFLLVHFSCFAQAQAPSVTVGYPELACLKTTHKIPVSITGAFNADNQFSVQLREPANNALVATLPATLKDQQVEVIYPDSALSIYPRLQLRIVTSSPKTESNWVDFKIHSKGIIQMSAAISDTFNLGEEMLLMFKTQSTTETDLTFSDGSTHDITSYSPSEFTTFHSVNISSTSPFSIKTATNSCGAMRVVGQIKPVASRVSVRTKSVDARNSCEGSEVKIGVATLGSALPSGSGYKVRFRSINIQPTAIPIMAESPAEMRDGVIVTRIPDFALDQKQDFNLIIISAEQRIVGAPGNVVLSVFPKPEVDFYTPNTNIKIGKAARVGVIFKGVPPFSAELGDGSSISASYSGEVYLEKSPDKTTTYEIRSMSSGCGVTNLSQTKKMTVGVTAGIAVVPESNATILCAGTKVKIPVRSNGNFTANTTYIVHASYGPSKEYRFAATRNGDFLEFQIPELPVGTAPEMLYDGLNNLYVSSANPVSKSEPIYTYLIQSKPQIISNSTQYTFDEPGKVQLSYRLYGKWPFTIEDEKGDLITVKNDWWAPEIYLDKTKDFKIRSISNSCYKTENIPATRLTLNNNTAPGLHLERIAPRVCTTDSLELQIIAPGNFAADNEFQIQAYADCCNFATLKTVRSGGTYKVKIPASQNGYVYPVSVKVISTNPFLTSETYQFAVDAPLKDVTVNPAGTQAAPAMLTNSPDWRVTFSATGGGIKSAVYSDGKSDKTVVFDEPFNLGIKLSQEPGETAVYTLKSLTNTCGTIPANLSTYIRIVPFEIGVNMLDFNLTKFCGGDPVSVPFSVTNGLKGDATFSLEILREGEADYRAIARGESGTILNAKLPTDLPEGYYKMRVVSSNGVASDPVQIFIGVAPGATISSKLPQPVSWTDSAPLDLDLNFTGTAPWTAVFEDNTSLLTSANPTVRRLITNEGGVFELKTVYNQCGYGKVSGTVLVNVAAKLEISAQSYAACNGKAFPVDYRLVGDADLSSDYIRFELIDPATLKSIQLDSTRVKSGKINLQLPGNLTGAYYKIRSTVRKANLSSEFNFNMTQPAKLTLSGSTVINSGESTQLVLETESELAEIITYQLSDGTKGNFYAPGAEHIRVNPLKTTTYTITNVSSVCGAGTGTGSATVEVNPPASRTVQISRFYTPYGSFCIGDSLYVIYTSTGTFSAGNVMSVQLSDAEGRNFKSIPTVSTGNFLRTKLPSDLVAGRYYRMRVAASDPGTASGAYESPLLFGIKSGAQFASNTVEYSAETEPVVVVNLTGSGPWQYELGNNNTRQIRYSSYPTDSVYIQQAAPGETYRLLQVSGLCGPGIVGALRTVTVSLITSAPNTTLPEITFGPNPTQDILQVHFKTSATRTATLIDIRGRKLRLQTIKNETEILDISRLAAGIYLLQIEELGEKMVFRVVKL